MSEQDEAFEAWWTIEHQKVFGRSVTDIAESAWNACLAAHADALELARRVEALSCRDSLQRNYPGGRWTTFLRVNSLADFPTALEALRSAQIGDE